MWKKFNNTQNNVNIKKIYLTSIYKWSSENYTKNSWKYLKVIWKASYR